jgi:hypothetical protein
MITSPRSGGSLAAYDLKLAAPIAFPAATYRVECTVDIREQYVDDDL